jgi:hypothetical protein
MQTSNTKFNLNPPERSVVEWSVLVDVQTGRNFASSRGPVRFTHAHIATYVY